MHKLLPDVQHGRRARLHHVFDETETIVWSGKTLGAALDWLTEEGVNQIRVNADEGSWVLAIQPVPK